MFHLKILLEFQLKKLILLPFISKEKYIPSANRPCLPKKALFNRNLYNFYWKYIFSSKSLAIKNMKCYLFIGPFNIHGFFNKKNLKKFKIINGMLKWLVQRQDVDKSCVSVWMDVTCGYILSLNAIFILCHFIMETFLHIYTYSFYIHEYLYFVFKW